MKQIDDRQICELRLKDKVRHVHGGSLGSGGMKRDMKRGLSDKGSGGRTLSLLTAGN